MGKGFAPVSCGEIGKPIYQAEASPHLSRELLVRAVAYRMQEVALLGRAFAVASILVH
jgi:hypothetical protein